MAHIETKDPFGFVGSHVVRRQPRKGKEEHGWLTRYDESLDCYTLFVPGGGEPRRLARGEVMKFLSAPNIEIHDDDQAEFPPPIRDTTTSRYLGIKLRRSGQESSDEKWVEEDVRGHVTCFLPFGDRYCVEYEDGSTEEVSESGVIDGMIALIKSPFFSSPRRNKTRTRKHMYGLDGAPTHRKRQRVESNDGKDEKNDDSNSIAVVKNEKDEQDDDDVEVVEVKPEVGVVEPAEPAPNILSMLNRATGSLAQETSLEMASHPIEEELMVIDNRQNEVRESGKSKKTPEAEGKDTQVVPPLYIVHTKEHRAVEPLPRRAMAFELLRASLLNLLDRQEASEVKTALQYDLLGNPDVRDRDAVIRFLGANGLIVLKELLNSFAIETPNDDSKETKEILPEESQDRDDDLLHVLKIVAMCPTPSRDQVLASQIGKTIHYLSKKRGPPGCRRVLPQCIIDLAKWIKRSWIKNIPPAPKTSKTPVITRDPSRSQQHARRGGRGGSSGRPSAPFNRRQPPPSQRLRRQVVLPERTPLEEQDNKPIPRLPSSRPPAAATPLFNSGPRRVTGGLKPDWMRQKEHLSRSRFCIKDNTTADAKLYQARRANLITNVPVATSQAPAQQSLNPDQHESAGGPDGVFGRPQRLRFNKKWSTHEFGALDPPGTLRQSHLHRMSSYGRSDHSPMYVPPVAHSSRPTRSILRHVSRYNDEPVIDGPGT